MMLNDVINALNGRKDLMGWTVREIRSRGVQSFVVPRGIEAARKVEAEVYKVHVFCRGRAR